MASSSHAVTDTVPLKKYEVFISFRGEDTRRGFTSHLHAALCRSYVQTYIDNRIDKGDEVWAELEKAIKESTLFLVVFSENYASSMWCLNELVEIMKCKKYGQDDVVVIPVFYDTDPSDVRKQRGSYHTALAKHKKQGKDKMQKWKDALCEAANLSGFHSTKYESEPNLIDAIIKEVSEKLKCKCRNELRCDFIRDENYSRLESLIKNDSREVQIIGLWGMGGIGKTALAAAIYHHFSFQYEGSYFVENVTEESKRHGLHHICNKLLSTLLMEDLGIVTLNVIPSFVKRRLKRMKVFIVLDGLNNSELLENLVGKRRDWLGDGSKVIVTTRDKYVLVSGGVDKIHEVEKMNFQNSLRLFSANAFDETHPKQGYEELSKRAIDYAKGIPLALTVLGSFLRSKSAKEWDSALSKLKEIPNAEIQKVLKLSYDELDDDEKNIFLDIACFFKGYERYEVTKILNKCDFFAEIGIRNLLDKTLIRVGLKNCIEMHDLVQEMGREIVRKESSTNPGRRSRLWDPKEVCDVLTNNRGTRAVEAIFLDVTQITHINLSSKAFKKMSNLRLLAFWDLKEIHSMRLPMGLDFLPESLRCFRWDGYPLTSLPLTFCAEKLVELSMQNSNVEKLWNGVQNLPNLKTLDLSGSKRLIECPNLSGAKNLERVNLDGCVRLPLVDPLIFSLEKLQYLNVSRCMSLKSLSSDTCSTSLQYLFASACWNLQEFSIPLMPSSHFLRDLRLALQGWCLNELPSSVLHVRDLQFFSFQISDHLMHLPQNFAHRIEIFDPLEHERDTSIPLREELPSHAFLRVRHLEFTMCNSLHEIPEKISLLSSLESLQLFGGAIVSLPQTIKDLPRLVHLYVHGCKMLRSIPALPQSILLSFVQNCESLQTVSSSTGGLSKYFGCGFAFLNCTKLNQHSYDTILKDAFARIELKARLLSLISENEEDASLDYDDDDDDDDEWFPDALYACSKVTWYFLPVMSGKFRDWFHYHSTQALVCVELPPNLLGFTYYLVLSQGHIGSGGFFGCECCLETSSGERIIITSFGRDETKLWFDNIDFNASFDLMSDHVLLWYDARCCKQIMETVEERKAINDVSTSYNPKLTFRFFVETVNDEEVAIKECGFRWIYPSGDQIDEGGRCKSKRSREIHEAGESKSDEQEGTEQFLQQRNSSNVSLELELCPIWMQIKKQKT